MSQYSSAAHVESMVGQEFQPFLLAGKIIHEAQINRWNAFPELHFHYVLLRRVSEHNLGPDVELNVVNMIGNTFGILEKLLKTYHSWKLIG